MVFTTHQAQTDTLLAQHDKDFNQEHFVRLLAEWQVACDQPFDEVEKPEFQALLQYAHGMNRLAFPSQQTMKRRVMDLSASTLEETKAMIKVCSSSFYTMTIILIVSSNHLGN